MRRRRNSRITLTPNGTKALQEHATSSTKASSSARSSSSCSVGFCSRSKYTTSPSVKPSQPTWSRALATVSGSQRSAVVTSHHGELCSLSHAPPAWRTKVSSRAHTVFCKSGAKVRGPSFSNNLKLTSQHHLTRRERGAIHVIGVGFQC